jgi:hypothetical protein
LAERQVSAERAEHKLEEAKQEIAAFKRSQDARRYKVYPGGLVQDLGDPPWQDEPPPSPPVEMELERVAPLASTLTRSKPRKSMRRVQPDV